MTAHEESCNENKEILVNIHRTIDSLAHFLKKFFQFMGAIAGAVIIAIAIAYALHWLHLK